MKKADFIVIATVLGIAAVILAVLYGGNSRPGYAVRVEVNTEVVDILPLGEDIQKEIISENGSNTLVIKDGYASVTQASCPDGICVNHRRISRPGESIICLPNKVVITVISEKETGEVDAVA